MFVARYEDLVATPERVLTRLHRFLEVPARPEDAIAPPRVNEASGDPAEAASLAAVRAACAESTAQLVDWYGPAFAWPEFS